MMPIETYEALEPPVGHPPPLLPLVFRWRNGMTVWDQVYFCVHVGQSDLDAARFRAEEERRQGWHVRIRIVDEKP